MKLEILARVESGKFQESCRFYVPRVYPMNFLPDHRDPPWECLFLMTPAILAERFFTRRLVQNDKIQAFSCQFPSKTQDKLFEDLGQALSESASACHPERVCEQRVFERRISLLYRFSSFPGFFLNPRGSDLILLLDHILPAAAKRDFT
jgi:hypothetical protein